MNPTEPMSKKFLSARLPAVIVLWIVAMLLSAKAQAQCQAPTNATITSTPAACQGQGRIVAKVSNPPSGAVYEYQLQYDSAANTSVVKPWQSSDTFTLVSVGQYKVYIRRICTSSVSTQYVSASVTVSSSTTPLSITQAIPLSKSSCANGSLKVTAAGGNTAVPYQYALVPTLNEPEPVTSYVRPKQSSNTFGGLAAGTYYARVYDSCGSYVSATVVIDTVQENPQFLTFRTMYSFYGCDSLNFAFRLNSNTRLQAGPQDTAERFWIRYNGVTDTFTNITYSGSIYQTNIISKVLPITAYPAVVAYGYKSVCGNIFEDTATIAAPNLGISIPTTTIFSLSCTERRYYIRATDSLSGNYPNYYNTRYSSDSGATWSDLNTTTGYYDTFTVGSTHSIWLASGCDTAKTLITIPAPILNMRVNQFTAYSCNDNSGIHFQFVNGEFSGVRDSILIRVLSQPATDLPDSFYMWQQPQGYNLSYNITPGTYQFVARDQCGTLDTVSKTINPTVLSYTIAPLLSCIPSQSGFRLTLSETNYQPYAGYSYLRAIVTNTATNQVDSFLSASQTSRPTTIDVTGISNGNYTIKVIRVVSSVLPYPTCSVDSFYTNTANQPLSLSQSAFTSACADGSATVSASAQGGGGGYQFSLDLQGGGGTWSQVAGPQTSPTFNNLVPNNVYRIRVTDVCGNGTQYSTALSSAPDLEFTSSTAPCPGDAFTMLVDSLGDAIYTWQKNSVDIAGATMPSYTVDPVPASGVDTYKVKIAYGTCNVLSNTYVLDPTLCGLPLPITLQHFNAYHDEQGRTQLSWTVADPYKVKLFAVEYSSDGRSFINAGTVESNNSPQYRFRDELRQAVSQFYRLRMISTDGIVTYSRILRLNKAEKTGSAVMVYPTLTSGNLTIACNASAAETMRWTLTDLKGNTPRSGTFALGKGANNCNISDLSALAEGIYILTLKTTELQHQERIVIRK